MEWNKKENIKARKHKHQIERIKSNINLRILNNLRGRISSLIKKGYKSKTTKELLGCSIEKFKKHIESKDRKFDFLIKDDLIRVVV
jgi:DNA-binding CsgD family transcriptional regulator